MKKIVAIIIIIIIVIGAISLVKKRKSAVDNAPTASLLKTTVEAFMPIVKEISSSESFLAKLEAVNEPKISSKLSGYVKKVYVSESARVKKGDLLVELDSVEVQGSVDAIKASVLSANLDMKLSLKDLSRSRALYDVGGISKDSYEKVELMVENKKAKLLSAKSSLSAKENLLTYTKITSPIDGVVGTIFIKEGSLSSPGKPIITIIGDEKQLIFSYAAETDIKVGQSVLVGGFRESISAIYQSSKNSLMTAQIKLKNTLNLPSGASVDIKVILGSSKGTVVPLNALLHNSSDVSVMVFKDGQFVEQKVKIKLENDEFAMLTATLKEPVAVGSEAKLSRLPSLKNIKVVFNGK